MASLSDYEKMRAKNIARNKTLFVNIGIDDDKEALRAAGQAGGSTRSRKIAKKPAQQAEGRATRARPPARKAASAACALLAAKKSESSGDDEPVSVEGSSKAKQRKRPEQTGSSKAKQRKRPEQTAVRKSDCSDEDYAAEKSESSGDDEPVSVVGPSNAKKRKKPQETADDSESPAEAAPKVASDQPEPKRAKTRKGVKNGQGKYPARRFSGKGCIQAKRAAGHSAPTKEQQRKKSADWRRNATDEQREAQRKSEQASKKKRVIANGCTNPIHLQVTD
jgi:hypothetical protein